jgi:hypothetical protein
MSMSEDTENFEQLRRLLVLKRYEQPPPRYFNDFSAQVIRRIKAGERGERADIFERLFEEAPWLQRIWAAFETKPILAGVLGMAMCGFLIGGMLYSDTAEVPPFVIVPGVDAAPGMQASAGVADHPLLTKPVMIEASSTSPITAAPTDAFLLGDLAKLRSGTVPASFSFPGGN